MGEEERDPQRLKRIAAAAYDYDNDPRWAEYYSNILIPPHMTARSDVVDHLKRKFYQRFIDPDLVVETMSSTSSSQSSRASDRPSSQPTQSSRASDRPSQSTARNVRPQNSGSGSGSTGTAASVGRNANPLRLDQRSIHFAVNAWVLVVAVLGMLPVASRNLSNKAYRLSLLGTACSSVYSVYSLYGKPRAWNLPAIQTWVQTMVGGKDFIHLIYCITLVTLQLRFKFALIPVFCWALDHVARFLRRNFAHSSLYRKYMEEPCSWVEANGTTLNILSSNAEIGMGFLLIISLFSWQRNIIQTFIYWQLLKVMYHVPVTAGYHQSAWARIGRTVNPYIYRYAPFLNSLISAVQRWWFRSTWVLSSSPTASNQARTQRQADDGHEEMPSVEGDRKRTMTKMNRGHRHERKHSLDQMVQCHKFCLKNAKLRSNIIFCTFIGFRSICSSRPKKR